MTLVEIPTLEDIKSAMKQVLKESLQENNEKKLLEKLLTKKEVSEVLNVSQSTVDNLRRQAKINSIKIPGGGVRFKYSEVIEFINKQNKES